MGKHTPIRRTLEQSTDPTRGPIYTSPTLKAPTRRGMAKLAIAVLEEVERAAWEKPIELPDVARLAIGWLMRDGIANGMQAGRFACAVTTRDDEREPFADYMRQTEMNQMLEAWRRVVRERDREAKARTALTPTR